MPTQKAPHIRVELFFLSGFSAIDIHYLLLYNFLKKYMMEAGYAGEDE